MPRVFTIAIVTFDEFGFEGMPGGSPSRPELLSSNADWRDLDSRQLPLQLDSIDSPPLVADRLMESGEVTLRWIRPFGRVACMVWSTECTAETLAAVDWTSHWDSAWRCTTAAIPTLLDRLSDATNSWDFSFSVVEGSSDELATVIESMPRIEAATAQLRGSGLSIGLGWNHGLIASETGSSLIDVESIISIAVMTAIRWQVESQALKRLRDLLGEQAGDRNVEMQSRETLSLARRVYHAQTALDHDLVGVQGEDKLVAEAFSQGWGTSDLSKRACAAIDRMMDANEIETRMQLRSSGRSQSRSLFVLTLIGAVGTLAGVLSAVDFRNAIFDSESMRILTISAGTMLLAGAAVIAAGLRRSI